LENKIITAAFRSRRAWDLLEKANISEELSDTGKIIYSLITSFYDRDLEATFVDKDIILSKLERKYPKHFNLLRDIVTSLEGEDVSIDNIVDEILSIKKHRVGLQLASSLSANRETDSLELIEKYLNLKDNLNIENKEEIYNDLALDALISSVSDENKIRLWPSSLNERVDGGALRGHHILIMARPECGKTLFAINMAAMMCKENHRVLYCGNEDPAPQMLMRFISRFSGMPKYQILQEKDDAEALARDNGYKNLIFAPLSPGTFREISCLIETTKPDIVFIDQIRNVNVHAEGLVNTLEKAAIEARRIAKKYNVLVVSVTQAGDSATNKLVLDMSDIDSSKTGLPAQVDLIIGIGMNTQYENENKRMLSLPKNKVSGDHSFFQVSVDPTISKVRKY